MVNSWADQKLRFGPTLENSKKHADDVVSLHYDLQLFSTF